MNHITRRQLDEIDAENERRMYGVSRPLCVSRILPPTPPRPRRTWEELMKDTKQIRRNYLKARGWL